MQLLFIHADSMEYEVKERTKVFEEFPDGHGKVRLEDALVVFVTVEKEDEEGIDKVAALGASEVRDVARGLKARRVLLYPYAHLSSSHSSPKSAIEAMKGLEAGLKDDLEVFRAPFGWYKSFTIACKGHPMSELSREVRLGPEGEAEARKAEDPGRYLILTKEGMEVQPCAFESKDAAFRAMVDKEALKQDSPAKEAPGYLRLCKKFGIEWESMSDSGHMRYGPKASLMFDLVADYSSEVVGSLGIDVFKIRGTNMFNLEEDAVREHADLFGDRLYVLKTDKKSLVLRYAACHQQFAMLKDWNISYRQLPFGAFEVADSYRMEQSGEAMLCFRVRRMNMPDLHIICGSEPEAKEWFLKTHERILEEAGKLDHGYEFLVNFSSSKAYEDNRDFVLQILRKEGKDCLIHIYPEGKNFYWTLNIEYLIIDEGRRPREIATVQIDVGNAKRFNIQYTDEEGGRRFPVILHSALIGTIERYLYMVFDSAVTMEKKGRPGTLPLWLNPEQVRLLTVRDEHREKALELARALEGAKVRVGIDERPLTVSKKVAEAKKDWVGYVVVLGDREMSNGTLKVYDREKNADVEMSPEDLASEIGLKTKGLPFRPLYFPRDVGKRPT